MTKKKEEDKSTIADKKTAKQVSENEELKNVSENEAVEEETEEVVIDEAEKLTADLAESKDKYLRLYSEFDNYRRRTAKEKLDLMQTAGERIIVELIPIIDDFERAIKSADSKDEAAMLEGLNLISQKFEKTMQNQGLKQMETPVGTGFDPDIHEAITQIPAPKKKLQGKIVDTIEKGYYLGEKVIRFAKVVTGS